MKRKTWRCFHCDEVFYNPKHAAEHFGRDEGQVPACKLTSSEGHLITYIRKLEAEISRHRAEDSDVLRAMYAREAEQREALIRAEERSYNLGVIDSQRMSELEVAP